MPELPDVEVFRRYLDATALHQPVKAVHVPAPEVLFEASAQGLGRALKSHEFTTTERHGKYLFAVLGTGRRLVLHFGMTGQIRYTQSESGEDPHCALRVDFPGGATLEYVAPRKLGRVGLAGSPERFVHDQDLGPDALAIEASDFVARSWGQHSMAKSWLMNQKVMAGVGNVYSDEAVFQARIHPRQPLAALDPQDLEVLHEALRRVLRAAIDAQADPESMPGSFLLPHREKGGRCPRCRGEVESAKVSGRTAWFCPECQQLR